MAVTIGYALCFRDMTRAMYGVVALYILSLLIDRVVARSQRLPRWPISSASSMRPSPMSCCSWTGVSPCWPVRGPGAAGEKRIILCAFGRRHFIPIKKLVQSIDPDAFVIVCDAHEVLGEGFGQYDPTGL